MFNTKGLKTRACDICRRITETISILKIKLNYIIYLVKLVYLFKKTCNFFINKLKHNILISYMPIFEYSKIIPFIVKCSVSINGGPIYFQLNLSLLTAVTLTYTMNTFCNCIVYRMLAVIWTNLFVAVYFYTLYIFSRDQIVISIVVKEENVLPHSSSRITRDKEGRGKWLLCQS